MGIWPLKCPQNSIIIAFLTTKYKQIAKLEHLLCRKIGKGKGEGHKPTYVPTFDSAGHVLPLPQSHRPLKYTKVIYNNAYNLHVNYIE